VPPLECVGDEEQTAFDEVEPRLALHCPLGKAEAAAE
jgi:hypothetical protein